MSQSQSQHRLPSLEELRAFVRGELADEPMAQLEAELDRSSELRAMLGVAARDAERTVTPRGRDPYIGLILGDRYRVIERIGEGGMGAVYAAEHLLLGRSVALKLLHPEFVARADVRRRFENEARAAAAIGHPGIVQPLDVGRASDGTPFLVFERLEGSDLEAHLVEHGALPVDEAVGIARAIADAVGAAHDQGIVHRDLKPANIFLHGQARMVKVLDFGVSKVRESLAGVSTQTGAFMGTPAYMAPEQLTDASKVDARADVYALGVVLFQLLTGELPHSLEDGIGALALARQQAPPSLRARRGDLPVALDAIVRRALAPLRQDRFVAMWALRDALAPFASEVVSRPSLRPTTGARRVVTILLAADVTTDPQQAIDAARGRRISRDDDHLLAVFGEGSWSHDVSRDVVRLAGDLSAGLVVVGAGRLDTDTGEVSGEALRTFERAREACLDGVVVSSEMASAFPTETIGRQLAEGLFRLSSGVGAALPFVGRSAELAVAREGLERCLDDREACALFIEGPPGIGKTRLVGEVLRALDPATTVLRARGRGMGRDVSSELDALKELLESLPGLAAEDPSRAAAIAALAQELDRPREGTRRPTRHGHYLRLLLGLAPDDATRPDAQLVADQLRIAVVELVAHLTEAGPVVVVVEDTHALSPTLFSLLERLLDRCDDRPLLVLVTSRQGEAPLDGPRVRPVRVRGLRKGEVSALAHHVLGDELEGEELRALVDRTGGNPFFVEQVLRAAARDSSLALPPSVEAAVQARLDALPVQERDLFGRASVFELPFSARDLEAVGVEDPGPLLEQLRRRELLRRRHGTGSGPKHTIASGLLAETAYRALLPETKVWLHQRAAELRLGAADPDDARVARHFDAAGDARAGECYERACLVAARRSDAPKAIRCGERAQALGREGHGLASALAEAYELEGRFGEEDTALEAALAAVDVPADRAALLGRRAVNALRGGRPDAAVERFAEAEAALEDGVDGAVRARVLGKHAAALAYLGRTTDAFDKLAEAERLVLTKAPELRADAAIWRGQIAAASGDLGDRRNSYWAAVELYDELGDTRRRAGAAVNLADVYNRLGAYPEAEAALLEAVADCRALALAHAQAYALLNLAYARFRRGDLAGAGASLDELAPLVARFSDPRLAFSARLYRARVDGARGAGDEAAALRLAEQAEAAGLPSVAILALSAAAEAAEGSGLEHSERAVARLDELGSLEEDEAEVLLRHSDALEAEGRGREGRSVAARARAGILTVARRIGDAHWRERYLSDVVAHRILLGGR